MRGWRQGDYLAFAVADAASDEYLGTIDLQLDGNRGGEVGFGLRAAARGRGAMTAAVRAVAGWAFAADGLGLGILQWRAQIGNWPSRRVAWRAGFRIEGTVRGLCAARGQRIDGWIGSLRPQDPREPATPWLDVPLLDGERCVLRRFRDSDVDAVVEGCTDPVTRHWLADLPTPYTAYEALAYIQSRENEHAAGRGIYWAAAEPGTDRCVGSFGLMDIQPADGSAEIGYWVHPAARARGVASEATRMIVRHAAIPDQRRRPRPAPVDASRGREQPRLPTCRRECRLRPDRSAARRRTAGRRKRRGPPRLRPDLRRRDRPVRRSEGSGAGASQGIEGGGCLPRRTAAPRVPVTFAAAVVRRGRAAGRRGLAGSVSEHATFAPDVETRYGISRPIQPMRKGQCGLGVRASGQFVRPRSSSIRPRSSSIRPRSSSVRSSRPGPPSAVLGPGRRVRPRRRRTDPTTRPSR